LLKVACSGPGVSRTRNLSVTSPILYQLDHCTHPDTSCRINVRTITAYKHTTIVETICSDLILIL